MSAVTQARAAIDRLVQNKRGGKRSSPTAVISLNTKDALGSAEYAQHCIGNGRRGYRDGDSNQNQQHSIFCDILTRLVRDEASQMFH